VLQRAGVVTPEAVLLDLPAAGLGARSLARLVDLLVLMGILYPMSAVIGFVVFSVPAAGVVLSVLTMAFFLLGYPVLCETVLRGRTIGKFVLGLRVVTREGGPIGFRHAMVRGLLGVGEVFATFGAVAVVVSLVTARHQRFGDLAAGTIVVRERDADRGALAVAFPPPPGYEAYCTSLDVSAIGDAQYGVIRSFLLRVLQLTPGARESIAVRIANPVAQRMRHTPPPMLSAEVFLACVASAYQVRHGGLLVPAWAAPPPSPPPASPLLPPPPGAGPW
jgi:uncharacterized RDD family membrane protein YckC